MKILWFSTTPCGSVRRFQKATIIGGWLVSLEDELKKVPDVSLEVAYVSRIDEPSFEYDGVRYHPLVLKKGKNPISRFWALHSSEKSWEQELRPQIKRLLDETDADIIHLHGSESVLSMVVPMVKDKPVVVSIQGMTAPYSKKYFSGLPLNKSAHGDSFRDKLTGQGVRRVWRLFQHKAMRESEVLSHAPYIFGRTFWDSNCTLALNPNRKYHIVNEILRPPFYDCQWKRLLNTEDVNIVSTISGGIYKGFEVVLETANLLKTYGGVQFKWHIVGYDAKTKWVKISEKYKRIKADDVNIILHGRKTAEELADLLSQSDMYVHVSHIENSPNSVCEAMLVGMPVIASYAGGTASLLQHEKEGILVQDGDPYVLAGAIIDMVQHPDKAVQYANNARQRALLRHDKTSILSELLDGYKSIIENYKKDYSG